MRTHLRILCLIVVSMISNPPARAIPVTGSVTTAEGGVLAGARAELAPIVSHIERARSFLDGRTRAEPVATAVSDGDGHFTLEAPAPGLYSVTVHAPGWHSAKLHSAKLHSAKLHSAKLHSAKLHSAKLLLGAEFLPLALTEARQLPPTRLDQAVTSTIEVRDTLGQPVAEAWVFASRSGGRASAGFGPAQRLARTDERGVVVLPRAVGERLDIALYVAGRAHQDKRRGVTRAATFTVPRAVPQGRYTVEVRDAQDKPLSDVVVALGQLAWPVGTTDAAGRLTLAVGAPAPATVQLLAAGGRHGQATLEHSLTRVVLPDGEKALGRVLSWDGRRPIEHALIWPASDPGAFALSDAEGRYTVSVRGRHLRAEAAGFLSARVDATSATTDLLLDAARPAHGRIVDPDGQPLAGAEVTVTPTSSRPGSGGILVASGADGRFRISHLPAERVDLLARHRGYAPTLARGVRAAVDLGTLILAPGAIIRGQVMDTAGQPVPEAGVWLSTDLSVSAADLLAGAPKDLPATRTDAAGTFAAPDLEPGTRLHLRVQAEGFLPKAIESVTAPTKDPLRIVLARAATVSGRVTDEDGIPVISAAVTLNPPPLTGRLDLPLLGREHHHQALTGADGRFTFDAVAVGTFEIATTAEGYIPAQSREVTVPSPSSKDRTPEIHFVLARGSALRGRVTTRDGEPVAQARVYIADASGVTDDDGHYLTAGIPLGRHQARVHHSALNQVSAEVEIEDGDNVHDFVLEAGHRVAGRVTRDDGTPVIGARVVFEQQGWENHHQFAVFTEDDGLFQLPQVADGRYRVSAKAAGHAFTRLPTPVEVDGAEVEGIEVVLPRGTVIAGRVLGLEADELVGIEIEARNPEALTLTATLDYEGAFEIEDAGPGDWLLVATTPDRGREARARVAVGAGHRQLKRDLEFGRGAPFSGRVLFGDEPLAGAQVSVSAHGLALERQVLADHQGAFHFRDLPPGIYRLAAAHPRELLVSNREVTVPGDGPVTIRLEGAKVHGYVRAAAGQPLVGAIVTLQQILDDGEGGSLYSLSAAAEGYFALPRLSAGRYRVGVRQDGYEHLEDEVELAAGVEAGPLHYELEPTVGLTFELAADAPPPSHVTVTVSNAAGQPLRVESRSVDAEGRVSFPTLAAGTWDLIVSAPGSAPQNLTVTVPGEPVPLALAPGLEVRVRVPDLVESGRASDERVAALRLLDAAGSPLLALDERGVPGRVWGIAGGTAVVEGVPPGQLTVHVEAADGRTWSGWVVLTGQAEVLLEGGGASLK